MIANKSKNKEIAGFLLDEHGVSIFEKYNFSGILDMLCNLQNYEMVDMVLSKFKDAAKLHNQKQNKRKEFKI